MTYEQEEVQKIIDDYKNNPELQLYKVKIKFYGLTKDSKTINITYGQLIKIFKMFSQYEINKG